ncbi:MAG: ATP-binding cassette domain-containing protein [Candidatus Dojkabacteria bacterium]
MKNEIITIKNFSKSFGDKKVIDNLSFSVYSGEIFAFLGANGSGKTTTIRCLLDIYKPDEGELLINNQRYSTDQSNILGYLPEERGLYLNSTVIEILTYFGELKGLSAKEAKIQGLKYLSRVEIADKANVKVNKLSSGQQQKIQLGITLINRPKLLILDEPTKGLDPVNRNFLMEMLLELNKEGSTILFSTHQMEEVEKIADRLAMIKDGNLKLYGEVNEVKEKFGNNVIRINYKGKLPENTELYTYKSENYYAELVPQEGIKPTDIIKYLADAGLEIHKFEVGSPSLNEIFIKVSNE